MKTPSTNDVNDISGIRLFKGILLNKYGSIFFMNSASKTMSTNKILCGNDFQNDEKTRRRLEDNLQTDSKKSFEISKTKTKNVFDVKYKLLQEMNQNKLNEIGKSEDILKNLEPSGDEFQYLHNEFKNHDITDTDKDKAALTSVENSLHTMRCLTYSAHELDSNEACKNCDLSIHNKSVNSCPDVENEIRVFLSHSLNEDCTDSQNRNFLLPENITSHCIDILDNGSTISI